MRSTKCHWCGEDYNDCNRCTHRGVYVEPERLALLERCAKDWAREQIFTLTKDVGAEIEEVTRCACCSRSFDEFTRHARNCHAAIILDLEREGEG